MLNDAAELLIEAYQSESRVDQPSRLIEVELIAQTLASQIREDAYNKNFTDAKLKDLILSAGRWLSHYESTLHRCFDQMVRGFSTNELHWRGSTANGARLEDLPEIYVYLYHRRLFATPSTAPLEALEAARLDLGHDIRLPFAFLRDHTLVVNRYASYLRSEYFLSASTDVFTFSSFSRLRRIFRWIKVGVATLCTAATAVILGLSSSSQNFESYALLCGGFLAFVFSVIARVNDSDSAWNLRSYEQLRPFAELEIALNQSRNESDLLRCHGLALSQFNSGIVEMRWVLNALQDSLPACKPLQ